MTSLTQNAPALQRPGWFAQAEAWLDSKGKAAWIAVTVLGFILFWPVGLALIFYMIWSKNMFKSSCRSMSRSNRGSIHQRSTGNNAFDAYKADTLRRLEDEQDKFEAFLERLRDAKDKAEFDQFMEERAARTEDRASEA